MKCHKCDSENADQAKFCTECGANLAQARQQAKPLCPACEAELKPEARFCQNCGAAVTAQQTAPAPEVEDDDDLDSEPPRREMKYVILPLIFVPILIGIFYLLSFRSQNPESQSQSQPPGANPQADMSRMMPVFQQIDSLRAVLAENPADTTALLVLGEMFELAGKFEDARSYYERFLTLHPGRSDIKLRVLGTLISEHKHEAEDKLLNEILAVKSNDPHALMHIGDLYDRAGKADKATDFYNRALKADPEQVDVFMRLAGLSFNAKEYEKAREMLLKVLDKQPNNPHALYNYALALHLQGEHEQAVAYWQKTVEVDANGDIGKLAREALDSFQQIKDSN